jgi:DNA-binding IclR family transcriptional regulator
MATANPQAWTRFAALLAALRTGDLVTVEDAVAETGISVLAAERVLDTLTRAELLEQHGRDYVRSGYMRGRSLHVGAVHP